MHVAGPALDLDAVCLRRFFISGRQARSRASVGALRRLLLPAELHTPPVRHLRLFPCGALANDLRCYRFVVSGHARLLSPQSGCLAIVLAVPASTSGLATRNCWTTAPASALLSRPRLLEITDCFTGGHEPGRDDTFSGCRLPAGVVLYKVLWKMVMRTTSRFCLSSKASLVITPLRCEVIPMLGN